MHFHLREFHLITVNKPLLINQQHIAELIYELWLEIGLAQKHEAGIVGRKPDG